MADEGDRERLIENLRLVRRAMAHDLVVGVIGLLGQADLSIVQLAALALLEQSGERSVNALARDLGRSISATSRLLDQLVRRRLVRRTTDPLDRRARTIAITDSGSDFLDSLMDRRADAQLHLMAALSDDERARVLQGIALLGEAARRTGAGSV